jgi:transcriptional antiterminator NusG
LLERFGSVALTYYVIQVKTRGEEKYLSLAEQALDPYDIKIIWPRRSLRIRRRGKWLNILSPIFPGYLFLEVETIKPELYWVLKKLPGFFRFLKNNHDIQPLPRTDARILASLLSFGEIVDRSLAVFDEGGRIRVLEGPLKGLEGLIMKVDKRKGRVKVKLDLYDESYHVDFGFSVVEKAEEGKSHI